MGMGRNKTLSCAICGKRLDPGLLSNLTILDEIDGDEIEVKIKGTDKIIDVIYDENNSENYFFGTCTESCFQKIQAFLLNGLKIEAVNKKPFAPF